MTTHRQFLFLSLTACAVFAIAAVNTVSSFFSSNPQPLLWLALSAGVISALQLLVLIRLKRTISDITTLSDQHLATVKLDADGVVYQCSQHFAALLETTPVQLIGKPIDNFLNTQSAGTTLPPSEDTACELSVKANPDRWLSFTALPEPNQQVLVVDDISDKKTAEALSLLDTMTGLRNRNAFDAELPQMVRKAQRNDSYLSLAILNFDLFNEFNSSFGHDEGDKALSQVAEALSSALRRPTDHCYRLSSDEFVIVFENDFPNVCRRALDKVLKTVENLHIPQQNSPISPFLTVSIGAFGARGMQLSDHENIYMTADLQLYKAKQTRNCVHSFFPNETVQLKPEALVKTGSDSIH